MSRIHVHFSYCLFTIHSKKNIKYLSIQFPHIIFSRVVFMADSLMNEINIRIRYLFWIEIRKKTSAKKQTHIKVVKNWEKKNFLWRIMTKHRQQVIYIAWFLIRQRKIYHLSVDITCNNKQNYFVNINSRNIPIAVASFNAIRFFKI